MAASIVHSSQPFFPAEEIEWVGREIATALATGALTRGPHVKGLERDFAAYTGSRHAVAVSNGTAALELIFRALDLRGGEVIVPTNTFLSSANAVIFAGGVPVLADVDAQSLCLGIEDVERAMSPRTRAVVVVHIAGLVCPEVDAIRGYCARHGLRLVEDAAHAHGAGPAGGRAGALGDAAAFSFFPTKPMTAAEGGMITTDDDALAEFTRTFRNHGVAEGKGVHESLGANERLDEVRAIIARSQLRTLERSLAARRRVAALYVDALACPHVQPVPRAADVSHSYYKFPVLLDTVAERGRTARALRERHGIETGTVYWPPCHRQPIVHARPDLYRAAGPYPKADDVLPRVLCLPMYPALDDVTVDRVARAVRAEVGCACRP